MNLYITFSSAGPRAVYSSSTETVVTTVSTVGHIRDDLDLALMDEAQRDYEAGRGGPVGPVFDAIRSQRGKRAETAKAAAARS